MSLNIKNPSTHALVRQLATATGQSQTQAVHSAVERYLAHFVAGAEQVNAQLDQLLRDFRANMSAAEQAAMDGAEADLYDETGLPQ